MPRFLKGTTDHDLDGRMGGSLKGDTDMVKTTTKKAAAKKAPAKTVAAHETPEAQPTKAGKKAAAENQFAKADAAGDVRNAEVAQQELAARKAALGW